MPTGIYKRSLSQTLAQKERARKQGEANRGKNRPDMLGENHWLWKGDKVRYGGLHDWVRRRLGKPIICNFEDITCKGVMDWTNISGEYKRDVNDFISLCRSHHRRFDYGRKKI